MNPRIHFFHNSDEFPFESLPPTFVKTNHLFHVNLLEIFTNIFTRKPILIVAAHIIAISTPTTTEATHTEEVVPEAATKCRTAASGRLIVIKSIEKLSHS